MGEDEDAMAVPRRWLTTEEARRLFPEPIDPDKVFSDEKLPEGYTARREELRKK